MSHFQQDSSNSGSDGGQNSNSNITSQSMQKDSSYSSMLTYNSSDIVMSPFSDTSDETTGYFSFRSIGLHEPEYFNEEEEEDGEEEDDDDVVKDVKSKATLPTSTRRSSTSPGKRTARVGNGANSKKIKLSNRDRSGSLSRLFGILSPSTSNSVPSSPSSFKEAQRSSSFTSLFSLPRAIVGHPGHVTPNQASPMIWEKTNFRFPRLQLQRSYTTTDMINDNLIPTRPKLLTSMKIKSDPCIDVDWSIYDDPYNLYSRRRCSEGFLVNAESSLRDVLW